MRTAAGGTNFAGATNFARHRCVKAATSGECEAHLHANDSVDEEQHDDQ